MRIRIKRNKINTAGKAYQPRHIYDVTAERASEWIKRGLAELAPDKKK